MLPRQGQEIRHKGVAISEQPVARGMLAELSGLERNPSQGQVGREPSGLDRNPSQGQMGRAGRSKSKTGKFLKIVTSSLVEDKLNK